MYCKKLVFRRVDDWAHRKPLYIAYGHTGGKDCVSPTSRFHPTDNKMASKRNVIPTLYSLTLLVRNEVQ